ncbi:general odorant-binding protein 19d-like [Andrena cerasifolii]|uniref:general odorant-binding protein 19d-like n=1 Tax=Andrena cerasifolii TaxID=2819439 RepID=UPI004037ECF5
MKTIALILALCVSGTLAAISSEQIIKLLRYKDECMGETGINDEMIEKAIKEGINAQRDKKVECFMACILKKVGVMNHDGSINLGAAKEHAPVNVTNGALDDTINKCKDTGGANDCEKAASFVDCVMDKQLFNV